MERLYHMERHWLANQTVIQLEKTLTDNTDAGARPSWHDTSANYQTYDIGQIFKHLHDKDVYKGSFFPQTIRDWNALPDSLISSAEDAEDCVAKFTSLVRARD